ncbi:MAG: chromosome segregation protein SMC [Gammaproteobacteria bacterium]|nr:chromosome segregation protein SMC [Gammaproteobacteria bacterium]
MRLKHIKLAGFKSFVDPTTVSVPANLVGVVGPNGCGKSNVIDAIRWVMGESSAKTLRGDQMADVIFNGSSARKPVSKASVELVFDNSGGKAPGPYAQYNEISVRRELSRDGQSSYFINRTRTRRRDITDIFLGTGLGPRSYSIIEQGMVGRIIEAKPEELRVLIEEAAGISKYKERRRETETRIRHTRENLERVEDIRKELEGQLKRLKRQSEAAEEYKTLREEERQLKSQLLSLRWQGLDGEVGGKDTELARLQKLADEALAKQRGAEKTIESLRSRQTDANESFNKAQGEYYRTGADISGVEQNIKHLRESREQQQQELERLTRDQGESRSHMEADQRRIEALRKTLSESEPDLNEAAQRLARAEAAFREAEEGMTQWQAEWERIGAEAAAPDQERQVQQTRIEEYENQITSLVDRQQRQESRLAEIDESLNRLGIDGLKRAVARADESCGQLHDNVEHLEETVRALRHEIEQSGDEAQGLRDELRTLEARLESLRELQASDLQAGDSESLDEWLERTGIKSAPRLASEMEVEHGWETALDRVLGRRASAYCVDECDAGQLQDGSEIVIVERTRSPEFHAGRLPRLLEKVRCRDVDLTGWLGGVFVADDLQQALAWRPQLATEESIVTRDGAWVGGNWLELRPGQDRAGVVARESEIDDLDERVSTLSAELDAKQNEIAERQTRLAALEEELAESRRSLSEQETARAELRNELARNETRIGELQSRREQAKSELGDVTSQLQQFRERVTSAKALLSRAEEQSRTLATSREDLLQRRDEIRASLEAARAELASARDRKHEIEFSRQREETELTSLLEHAKRLERQQESMQQRQLELESALSRDADPEQDLKQNLEALLSERVQCEHRLAEARRLVENIEEELRQRERERHGHEQSVQGTREEMEQVKIARQDVVVRRDTVREQIEEIGQRPEDVLDALPEDADEEGWQDRLDKIVRKIDRIGPVNLVAIEEFEEQSERKTYLDRQSEDLNEALATLESVIQKIDQETRARFKDTFEQLNAKFQEFFPKLFGGGSAYLELTSDNMLETGVAVMARPPGKRNSTIHLLSGGEKALTAVSLLFAFFDLNPAPFCVLDEVDAPLDDANVERYSDTLKTLSSRTQLIFITHNKITMESADILVGVTMGEPGVSRLVSVDVEEAVEMAAQ